MNEDRSSQPGINGFASGYAVPYPSETTSENLVPTGDSVSLDELRSSPMVSRIVVALFVAAVLAILFLPREVLTFFAR